MLSGIKPSNSSPTLGNYLGAIKPFVKYQDQYELYVFVADLHALTVYQEPKNLKENTRNLIATYLAAGLDPDKCTIFRQSDIPAHNQLEWVLTCNTNLSDLTNMPQYKNYVLKNNVVSSAGMLMYPSLMAADCLLYDADYIPVGQDQIPHVELARDIAETFNKRYGDTFKLPEYKISETTAKIMSLTDPTKKMSKSESDKGTIYLLDDIAVSKNKIMKAITDSENRFCYDPVGQPGLANLITIYSGITDLPINGVVDKFKDASNYGVFKKELANELEKFLQEFQKRFKIVWTAGLDLYTVNKGALNAYTIASNKLREVYERIGLF